jgi:hypothetical protein
MRKSWMRASVLAVLLVGLFAVSAEASGNRYPPDSTCQTNGVVRSILYLNGVVYLGGDFTEAAPAGVVMGDPGTVARAHLAACSETTGALLAWNPGANDRVYSLATDGATIYVGGRFTSLAGQARNRLGALTTAGALTAWDPGASSTVFVVRIGPNHNIFVGGSFGTLAGQPAARIGEVTPQGAPVAWSVKVGQVTGFACPPRCPPVVYAIAFSGTSVYFGGQFGLVNGVARNTAAAVDLSTGALLAWNPNIYAPANCPTCKTVETSRVYSIVPDVANTNRVYTCGGYWKVNSTVQSFNVSAFDPVSGKLDPTFTVQDDGDTPGCALRDGILYFGGHFNWVGTGCQHTTAPPCYVYHHVAAANVATNTVLAWNPGANSNHGIFTVAADATHVGFGGYQTMFGGRLQEGYASYSTTLP